MTSKEIEIKYCPTYNNIVYITYIFKLFFIFLIILSLNNIEKIDCICANIPEKRFLKEWFIFYLCFNIFLLLSFIISDKICYYYIYKDLIPYIIISLTSFISLIMALRLLYYLSIIRKDCKCGFGKLQKFIFWYLIALFSIIIFIILLLAIFFIIKNHYF